MFAGLGDDESEQDMFGDDESEQAVAKHKAGCGHCLRKQLCEICNPRGQRKGSLAVSGAAWTHRPDEDPEPAPEPVNEAAADIVKENRRAARQAAQAREAAKREAAKRKAPAEAQEPKKKPRAADQVSKQGKMKTPGCLPRGWCRTSRMGPCPVATILA